MLNKILSGAYDIMMFMLCIGLLLFIPILFGIAATK